MNFQNIFSFRNKEAYKEAFDNIKKKHPLIEVESGDFLYNLNCHMNSVHYALKEDNSYIVLCFQVPKESNVPLIHFINYHNNKYIDNTLGYCSLLNDYYFVKFINKNKYININKVFYNFRIKVKDIYITSYLNKHFSNIKF